MRIPKKDWRIVTRKDTVTKARLVDIMRELEPGLTRREAAKAYDRVTAAINGWLLATSKHLPKGLHARLLLANCLSVNLCWLKDITGVYPDHPSFWMTLMDRGKAPGPREYLRRQTREAYRAWKQSQGKPR